MFLFNQLVNRLKSANFEAARLDVGKSRKRRKRSGQRYFSGWIIREEVGADGTAHGHRTYIGPRYEVNLSKKTFVGRKITTLLFAVVTCCLMAAAIAAFYRDNFAFYVIVPQILSVIALLVLLWYSMIRCMHPKEMTAGEYREAAIGYPICLTAVLALLTLTAVMTVLQCVIDVYSAALLFSAGVLLIAGCIVFYMLYTELHTEYLCKKAEEEEIV